MRDIARQLAVRAHRGHDVVGLRADHQVVKAPAFAVFHVLSRGGGQLLGKRKVVALGKRLVERAGVHADADRDARLPGGIEHGVGFRQAADVAWIDAQLRRAAARSLDGDGCIEVHVGHDGQRRRLAHGLERVKAAAARDGHAHDLAPGIRQLPYLRKVRLRIIGRGVEHGLHHHGSPAAKRHVAHVHLVRFLIGTHSVLRQRAGRGPRRSRGARVAHVLVSFHSGYSTSVAPLVGETFTSNRRRKSRQGANPLPAYAKHETRTPPLLPEERP